MAQRLEGESFITSFLQTCMERGWMSCISMEISDSGGSLYRLHAGVADATVSGKPREITANTCFNIGSVTKPITAALIAKLMEWGELAFSQPVQLFIPEFRYPEITIRHLLDHDAGYDWQRSPGKQDIHHARQYLEALYAMDAFNRKPGESVEYFSAGYTILMDVIERVTASPLDTFAREVLFNPLGMAETTYDAALVQEPDRIVPQLADGSPEPGSASSFVVGEGGIYSHPSDLMKFARMILNRGTLGGKQVFHERTIDCMLRESSGMRYRKTPVFWMKTDVDTFGFFGDLHSGQAVGHTGYSGCMMWIDPHYDLAAAILTNSTSLHSDWNRYKQINNVILSHVQGR